MSVCKCIENEGGVVCLQATVEAWPLSVIKGGVAFIPLVLVNEESSLSLVIWKEVWPL